MADAFAGYKALYDIERECGCDLPHNRLRIAPAWMVVMDKARSPPVCTLPPLSPSVGGGMSLRILSVEIGALPTLGQGSRLERLKTGNLAGCH